VVPTLRATQTSYAILGLLAVRSWTTYELAQQSERSLRWFFPRAERAVYLEAKRLQRLGWADARTVANGRRTSTVYAITDAGRAALEGWLAEPSSPPQVESEGALKVFFADQGTGATLQAAIADTRMRAAEALKELSDMASDALEGHTPFASRLPTTVLSMKLIANLHAAIWEWTNWAEGAAGTLEASDPASSERQTRGTLEYVAGLMNQTAASDKYVEGSID
jgi:PadR family transcriptional regulator AphA